MRGFTPSTLVHVPVLNQFSNPFCEFSSSPFFLAFELPHSLFPLGGAALRSESPFAAYRIASPEGCAPLCPPTSCERCYASEPLWYVLLFVSIPYHLVSISWSTYTASGGFHSIRPWFQYVPCCEFLPWNAFNVQGVSSIPNILARLVRRRQRPH